MLVLITSVHPWNYNRIYQNTLLNRFNELKAKYGIQQKDLDNFRYERLLSKMPKKDAIAFNNTIHDIRSYDYRWADKVLGEECSWVGLQKEDSVSLDDPKNSYEMNYRYSFKNIPLTEGYKYIEELDKYSCYLLTDETTSEKGTIGYACNDSTFIYRDKCHGDFLIRHKNINDSIVYTFKSVNGDALLISTRMGIIDYKKNHKDMNFSIGGYILYNNPIK